MSEPDGAFQVPPKVLASTLIGDSSRDQVGASVGPYKLLQRIGEGGFGVVYMAEQEKPVRRMVALKIIKPGMDTSQVVARFESERQALALMDHPNIAKVLDAGATASGHPYFVMELVKGVPITDYCDKNHLPPEARLKLFVDVCHAIQHAHHKGIIHRDIKPSNVLVTLHDGVPVVKVIDFGVAKATVQKLTEKTLFTAYGQMIGTPEYMSPEQAEMSGLDIDTRTDVYSLGVLLYELLTGTTPLEAKQLREAGYARMQKLIQEEEPPRPSTRLSSLGDTATMVAGNRGLEIKRLVQLLASDLDWVVMKALEKDRNRRYPTPGSFAEDVERYLREEAITARPPSTAYRLKKLLRRNRGAALAVTAVALALVAGTGVASWEALRAIHAERNALVAARAEKDAAESARKSAESARNSAEAEKKARQDALVREGETNAVLSFVENRILAAARPKGERGGLGRDVTLRKAIESSLPDVSKSFATQPLIEARLRETLAQSLILLGDSRRAAEQAEAARALYSRHRGADDPDTLGAMFSLARAYEHLGRLDEAVKLAEQTLKLYTAKLGADHPKTLESMNRLANSYSSAGRVREAHDLYEKTLARRKAVLGTDHADTLTSMNNLAGSYYQLGRYNDALKLHEETLALSTARLGSDHPETLRSMHGLADDYRALGRHKEAVAEFEKTLALQRVVLGPSHHETLGTMNSLIFAYNVAGRRTDALDLGEQALALERAQLGPDHPITLGTMVNLANTYSDLGRKADALALRRETLALQRAKLGPNHRDTLESMGNLASSYADLGQHSEALKLGEETSALMKKNLGADHPDTFQMMSLLAYWNAAVGRHGEAAKLLEQAVAGQKVKLGADHPDTAESINQLAQSYHALGRYAEALKLREEALRIRKARLGPRDPETLNTMRGLATDLLAAHRASEAAPVIHEAAAQWEKLKRTDAESLYSAACFHAVAAGVLRSPDTSPASAKAADEEAARAMAWLKQAVAAGYKDGTHIEKDDDLEPLRARDD
ncbi:MAG TPA: serine/threonine-protein kinase, partial [Planctomycetaceae bacterium]|nr:serine/threonine-protein kinase [Planctomycetaceae bacterium]